MTRHASTATPLVLVNLTANDVEARRTFDALDATARAFLKYELAYLGGVPRDAKAGEAVRRQCHLLSLYPQAPASVAIEAVARTLHGRNAKNPSPVLRAGLR
jgi:flagellar biosynthesis protein FlhG